jgi:hypothetical protein
MKARKVRRQEAWAWVKGIGVALAILLLIWIVDDSMSDAWISSISALAGVFLGFWINQYQTQRDQRRRRQALATALLGEIRFLEFALYRIYRHQSFDTPSTIVYDHAGEALLLFSVETVHAVTDLYQRAHAVSALVTGVRDIKVHPD